MILIGLNENQKTNEVLRYLEKHDVKKIIVFYSKKFPLNLPLLPCEVKTVDYDEIIMYRTFYPLLEEIDKGYLLIINELLRDKNRNNLTFNCLRHYLNQCGDQIIFEYFPFIESTAEFMTLLDWDTQSKFKGNPFEVRYLEESYIRCLPHHYKLKTEIIDLPATAQAEYDKKKQELFEELGNKDPDTIPRNLHLWCGSYKKPYISPEIEYVARNQRFKLPNVHTYKSVENGKSYVLLDMLYRQLDMNDFLRITGQENLIFISTGFNADTIYIDIFDKWIERLEEFYAKASVYTKDGT